MNEMTVGERSTEVELEDFFKDTESELEPLHIRLERIQLETVEKISDKHGLSKAEVVRKLLSEGLRAVLKEQRW